MSTLHTVNKSPFTNGAFLSCLKHCRSGDAVLMIEDGVYGALANSAVSDAVAAKPEGVSLFVLGGDASARGIDASKMMKGVGAVDYDGFVDLVIEHDRTQAWL